MRASILAFIREAESIKPLKYIHSFLVISGLIRDRLIVAQLAKSLAFSDNLPLAYALLDQVPPRRRTPFLLNSLLSDFAAYPRMPKLAFSLYKRLVHGTGGFAPDEYTFPVLLKSCSRSSGLEEGRQVHGVVVRLGHLSDIYVQNGLVHLYAACCLFVDARALFDEMLYRDVVSWTGLISGYVKGGSLQSALQLFCEMDVTPNDATLVSVLVACGKLNDLTVGRGVHGLILKRGVEEGLVISNALLDMYVKCGSIHEAKVVFWSLQHRDIVSWTSIITGLVHCRRAEEALEVFCHMRAYRVVPDKLTLASVLSACASSGQLDLGGWVHEYIDRNGIEWDVHLGTALVDMYAKGRRVCGKSSGSIS